MIQTSWYCFLILFKCSLAWTYQLIAQPPTVIAGDSATVTWAAQSNQETTGVTIYAVFGTAPIDLNDPLLGNILPTGERGTFVYSIGTHETASVLHFEAFKSEERRGQSNTLTIEGSDSQITATSVTNLASTTTSIKSSPSSLNLATSTTTTTVSIASSTTPQAAETPFSSTTESQLSSDSLTPALTTPSTTSPSPNDGKFSTPRDNLIGSIGAGTALVLGLIITIN